MNISDRNMIDNKQISHTISYLRFPLTVAVVYIHFNIARKGISVHGINYGTDNPDWYINTIYLFSYVFASVAVPLFFFISGYLFFKQKDFNSEIYRQKIYTRMRTLLVPYILWNLIAIVFQGVRLLPIFSSLFPGAYKTEVHISLIRFFNTFFNNTLLNGVFVSPMEYTMTEMNNEPYPIDIPLWYIRDLMVMVLCSPIIFWLIKKCHIWYVAILGAIWCVKNLFFHDGGYVVMLITALFFFSWGGYCGVRGIDFVQEMRKLRWMVLLYIPIAFSDVLTIFTYFNSYIHNVGILLGIIAVINISSRRIEGGSIRISPILLNSTFFVYALHKLIIDDIAKIIFSALHLPDTTMVMLLFYIVIPIITIIVCILLYKLLNRSFPGVCKLLTGGR